MIMIIIFRDIYKFTKKLDFIDESEFRLFFEPDSIKEVYHIVEMLNKTHYDSKLFQNICNHYNEFLDKLEIKEKRYSIIANNIRSYHKLNLSEIWGTGVIPEIILGPLCCQEKKELRAFLSDNGLSKIKISNSKISIRKK